MPLRSPGPCPPSDQWVGLLITGQTGSHQGRGFTEDRSHGRACFTLLSPKCAVRSGAARHGAAVLRHSKHGGSRAHHTSRVQTDESLRVSTSSPASGLIRDNIPGPEGEEKCVRVKPERKNVCAARAVTDEVNELHHAACQREREREKLLRVTAAEMEAGRPPADKHRNCTQTPAAVLATNSASICFSVCFIYYYYYHHQVCFILHLILHEL